MQQLYSYSVCHLYIAQYGTRDTISTDRLFELGIIRITEPKSQATRRLGPLLFGLRESACVSLSQTSRRLAHARTGIRGEESYDTRPAAA